MLYNVKDKVPFFKMLAFGFQLLLSVFVATVLICQICGVSVSGGLFGAGLATIIYLCATKFESPMYISNSGAFVAPVLIALSVGGYTAVAIGGVVTCLIYCLFGFIFTKVPVESIYKVFPKTLIGSVTMVIGIVLMGFISTYVQIDGVVNMWGVSVAFVTLVAIALFAHYSKGMLKTIPFLLGLLVGYIYSLVLTLTGIYKVVDLSLFKNLSLFAVPDFAFLHHSVVDRFNILSIVILYTAYTISAMMEALSDHAALGNIIGVDLYKTPGLHRIFCGMGLANLFGSVFGGLGTCSYGEGVGCVGVSKVAAVRVTFTAALMMIFLSMFTPIQAFIASIPSCAFAGAAIILYGYIMNSGVKMLQQVDLNNQKNLLLVSIVVSIGVSGLFVGSGTFSISGTALALIVGVILNLILKEK